MSKKANNYVLIRNLSDTDNAILDELREIFGEKTNTKVLLRAAHLCRTFIVNNQKAIDEIQTISDTISNLGTGLRELHESIDEINDEVLISKEN